MDNGKPSQVCRPKRIGESSQVFRCGDQAGGVLRGLSQQRQQHQLCDVVLLADSRRLPAHRALLALSSPYFHAMFTLGMREKRQEEVELVGMSYIGLKAVVDFLYSGELLLDGENIESVLEAAHLLQVWRVVDLCCQYLEGGLSEDNFLFLQQLALLYSLERLDSCVDRFVLTHFASLSFTPDFLHHIPLHKLSAYLSSGQVQHDSEQALLQASLRWLSTTPERTPHARQLLSHIRFPLMAGGELVERVVPALRALLTEESCQALLQEALGYHGTPSAQPLLQTGSTLLRGGAEQLLLIGGEVSERGEELSANVCRLDAETGSWSVETELPAQRSHHCLAVLGGFIFTAGGSSSRDNGGDAACNLLHRYDPRHNQWSRGAPMNERRVDFYLEAVGESLIAVGGRNDSGALSSVEVYCPAQDCWSYVAPLPRLTYGHAGTVHRGVVYISGGHDFQIGPYRRQVLSYEPSRDSEVWTERPAMTLARGWHCMASLKHLIYALGGSDDDEDTTERFDILRVESYDPGSGQWTLLAPLLLPNSEAGVSVWAGRIYVLGGYSWESIVFSRATQVYDPDKDSWSRGPDLPKCVAGASACVCTMKPSPPPNLSGGEEEGERSITLHVTTVKDHLIQGRTS
ncbi:kelch-like protein 36 isoform X1 [Pseudochaenichthys georgianus]|uniref:kelch-like protein 36 isoform X1 n=1 Tax=Pseudochaenichthys georgianus TaxID=52239 RepID=UPI00146C0F87|nr:kelch-like protein 36 isoform X1 [Pseudochaenichthys georgianus]